MRLVYWDFHSLEECFLFNALWRLSPIGINLQGPILCWLQHGEILKQKSWPKNELTKNPNSTFVSDSGFFVSKRSTFLLKNFQPWVRMHRLGPCSFIPEVSHAIIIKQRNRNLCDTGSVRKSRKINGFTTTFRLHNGYNPSIEFIIIGQSRHEKDLVLCLMRILARCVEVLRQFDFPLKGRSELFEPRRGEFWAETLSFLGKADCLRTSASWHPATNTIPSLSHGPG